MFKYINVDKLLIEYPNLIIEESGRNHIPRCLQGTFVMNVSHNNIRFIKTYAVKIVLHEDKIPSVKDIGHHIDVNYPHKYKNRELCLGTDTEIILTCTSNENFDLYLWFNKFVISYFYSYEYYNRMGEYPFGERSHGSNGILEFYMDIFNIKNHNQAYEFLKFINKQQIYRGHLLCPCGSGKRIRNCHKEGFKMSSIPKIKERINEDLKMMKG